MAAIRRQVCCTFPKERIREPVLYHLGRDFPVIPNIRGATINDEKGIVVLELEGEAKDIDRALDYLRSRSVQVEAVESKS
jgi:L-aspartate semialdehyde sulfurtransferase ferredoxin